MRKAGVFFTNLLLARSWNTWLAFVDEIKQLKVAGVHALQHWTNMRVAQAWGSWRRLIEMKHENMQLAREHAARKLAYLVVVGMPAGLCCYVFVSFVLQV